ncbi:hypothetical protein [Hufsiella ginkgonis]|uniref:Uncharacterized protein n=1 Tax=Hufsiella ginkgonis TaxID=2695274 RepID=A0A7K1XSH6_9SPHI|nr:hypothetical protein [Hufsiella ginkgonis]MXV13902.1 hypothetical protein [Hufsiella ginkgonis]
MTKIKELDKIKQYIETELLPDLPAGFQNLEYLPFTPETVISRKAVPVDSYITTKYFINRYHKPISKCLTDL